MTDQGRPQQWICDVCGVTASWTSGAEELELPAGWIQQEDALYCLSCSDGMAREIGEGGAVVVADGGDGHETGTTAKIEFEIRRDPDRGDTRIARVCRASLESVRRVRERLGSYPTRPS